MASEELTQLSKDLAGGTKNTIPVAALGTAQTPLELGDTTEADVNERDALLFESQNAIKQIEGDLNLTREKMGSEEEAAAKLIKDLGQRDAYTANLEDKFGLSDLESKLSGLNAEISAENRLAPARLLQAQKDAEGTGLTMSSLSTRLSNRERDNAIRSLVLAAEADIVQGRVNAATARINRAVDAKFKPMEAELELRKFNLERIDKVVERTETKLSTEQQRKYDQQVKKIEKDEADLAAKKATIQEISTRISENGAPTSVVEKVLKAETAEEAIAAASQYLKDPFMDIEMAIKSAQLNKLNKEIAQIGASSSGGKVTLPNGQTVDADAYNKAQTLIEQVGKVKTHPGRTTGFLYNLRTFDGTKSKDFQQELQKLQNMLTIENLDLMSGVLTDKDIEILKGAATSLDQGMSGEGFDSELDNILGAAQNSIGLVSAEAPVFDMQVGNDGMLTIDVPDAFGQGGNSTTQAVSDDAQWWAQYGGNQ